MNSNIASPIIELRSVTHHYGIRPILKNISLTVHRGELLAIVGPNGMGKSTLLGVMAGTLTPVEGEVIVDGKQRRSTVENELEIRRQVVYLPNDAWLPKIMSGRKFILSVGRLYGIDELHLMRHADRLLSLFNLSDKADHSISSYSTGQQKKIALASALITEAKVLLLDEPFSGGLDPAGILALKRVLRSLADREDVTVVMATPVPTLIEELADRVAIVRDGTIPVLGTLDELREQAELEGTVADVLERLMHPETVKMIDAYFVE